MPLNFTGFAIIKTMNEISHIFTFLDYAGTFVFAATGAFAAAKKKHDIIAFCFFAIITGVGGGTLRDLLIGAPVFWINQPAYIAISIFAACFVWILGRVVWKFDILLWLDAIGLAAFCVVGANKAMNFGVSPLNCIMMGIISAVVGGIIRDVLANQQNMLLRREIYITAALVGAACFVILSVFNVGFWLSAIIAFVLALSLRAAAILFGLTLPGFNKKVE